MSAQVVTAAREAPVGVADATDARYVGLVTRLISFVIDAAVISLVSLLVGVAVGLIVSVLHFPTLVKDIIAVIGAGAGILWTVGYFVAFWSATGQTPGARVMQIRVVSDGGAALSPRRALVRFVGVVLAALPLFAGFIPILFDDRRRGFQDRVAGSSVVEAPPQTERRAQREAYRSSRQARAAH